MKVFALALGLVFPALAAQQPHPGKIVGNVGAPVRVEVFSDFQCPSCKDFHERTLPLLTKELVYTGKAYIIFREFPLDIPAHPYSREAAGYAAAAARIGKRHEVASALYKTQAVWGATGKVWETVASVLTPAEQQKVKALAKDPAVQQDLQYDVSYGKGVPISATPTLLLSRGAKRFPVSGTMRYDLLKSMIDDLAK